MSNGNAPGIRARRAAAGVNGQKNGQAREDGVSRGAKSPLHHCGGLIFSVHQKDLLERKPLRFAAR
jgi:hypothetical protein